MELITKKIADGKAHELSEGGTFYLGALEHKFLFVFFQFENKKLVLKKVKFWNMPYLGLLEAEKVWTKIKEIVAKGEIVKK